MSSELSQEPLLESNEIQGNILRGFDTQYLDLLGFKIDQPELARRWLVVLGGRVASLIKVHDYRLRRSAGVATTQTEVLLNIAFSTFGLKALGIDGSTLGEGLFNLAMGRLAGSLGDPMTQSGQPLNYIVGQDRANTPDVLFLVGCEDSDTLKNASDSLEKEATDAGMRAIYRERGNTLPGQIEHFGFRDGISQPGPRGLLQPDPPQPLTLRQIDPEDPSASLFGQPGRPLTWPGQYVFGYPTQTDDPSEPGPLALGPEWSRNGSLLIFRRLRQDVGQFRNFLAEAASTLSASIGTPITPDQVGAAIVGRWQDGTPTILNPLQPDSAISADTMRVNHFAYGGVGEVLVKRDHGSSQTVSGHPPDEHGTRCPFFAHVRKVNPRNQPTDQGQSERTLRFQMLRRGIPYGEPYGEGTEDADRGLLFLAYQTSFQLQFQTLNRAWMNNPDAPETNGEGEDLLVGQGINSSRFGSLRNAMNNETARLDTTKSWVIPTGGAFLFSPSLKFFRDLSRS